MTRRPPRSTLLPCTTLFRSATGPDEHPAHDCSRPLAPTGGTVVRPGGEARVTLGCTVARADGADPRSEEHTSELQSRQYFVCRLLLEKKHTPSIAEAMLYHL